MERVEQFHAAGLTAIELIAAELVGSRWHEPSVLDGYQVGGLAAHLGRGVVTVEAYLDADPHTSSGSPIDAPTYFATALGDHDPLNSEFHAEVRRRGARAAAGGQAALVAELIAAQARLAARPLDPDLPITVLGGMVMSLSSYLETRLVELVIHTVDLADSVDLPTPPFDGSVWEVVAATVTETARLRNDPRVMALGLARSDRYEPPRAF